MPPIQGFAWEEDIETKDRVLLPLLLRLTLPLRCRRTERFRRRDNLCKFMVIKPIQETTISVKEVQVLHWLSTTSNSQKSKTLLPAISEWILSML